MSVLCDECLCVSMSHMSNVKCSVTKKKNKKRNEGGPASSKEDSVQRGGTDSISFVGAMKW